MRLAASQAARKLRAKECSNRDPTCASAAMTSYVPWAYDAGIALAHGLDKLVNHKSIIPDDITADLLSQAIKISTFEGVSGPVSFRSNGDRRTDQFEYLVYNYHATTNRFETVGKMVDGSFNAECNNGPCAPMVFSDGSSRIPPARVRDVHG